MTPKEKAKDLWDKFKVYDWDEENGHMLNESATSDLAETAVDEILQCKLESECLEDGSWTNPEKYWQEVKAEIKKL